MSLPFEIVAPRARDRTIIGFTLLGVLAITVLLQIWRPYFYLTDDSFTGFFPVAVDTARSLWAGRPIVVNAHIFGGNYDMLHDPACIALWSPWLFLFSPLALTRQYTLIVDAISLANSCTIGAAFAGSMLFLRRRLNLATSDWAIVVATLSYTFTPYNLLIGSSWLGFLNAQTVFPIAVAASFARRWWLGSLCLAPAFIFGLVGGHLHPTIMAALFGGLMVAALSFARRSWTPLVAFGCGGLMAMLLISPLLWPAFQGFGQAQRSVGMTVEGAAAQNVPVDLLVESFLFGPLAGLWSPGMPIFESEPLFGLGLAFSLINIPAIVAVLIAFRNGKFDRISGALFALLLLAAVWTVHPDWLAYLHVHIPLVKSLRWPFRELPIILFVAHVLFVLNVPVLHDLARPFRLAIFGLGVASFSLILLNNAPSLNVLPLDRRLVLSGEADRYWAMLKATSPAPLKIVVGTKGMLIRYANERVPYSVLGAYNFAALFDVIHVSGYSVTVPAPQRFSPMRPSHWSGIFRDVHAIKFADQTPGLTLVLLRRVEVIRWTVATPERERWFRFDDDSGTIIEEQGPPGYIP